MADWWNPFDGDIIPGINVGNAIKQITTGQDQDIFDSVTNSNRPGQVQLNALPDWGVRPTKKVETMPPISTGGGGGDSGSSAGGGGVLGSSSRATSGSGSGTIMPALNQAAVNNTQISLDQLPALLQAALNAETIKRGNTVRGFDDQEAGQRKTYDQSTTTNQQNYDSNFMESIRSGIKGLGGLFNILRGTGAAGGTAEELARDTVGGVTANDIRTGADTQKTNQTSLDSTLSTFLTDLKGKRQAAEDTFENNKRAVTRDNQT